MISARISQYPQYLFLNQKFNFCFVPLKPPCIADIGGIPFYAICNFVNGCSEPIYDLEYLSRLEQSVMRLTATLGLKRTSIYGYPRTLWCRRSPEQV